MVKTLKELCEREPQLAASIRERLLAIGHELVGENIIKPETARKINEITGGEQTVSEYIRDMLYNAPIIINGYSSFEELLESLASGNGNGNTDSNGNHNYDSQQSKETQEPVLVWLYFPYW